VVRTAGLITLCSSLPFAAALFVFSGWVVLVLNVPERLQGEASLALKFTAIGFVLNLLNGVFNTPQLTRLRMDLNTFVGVGFRVAGLVAVPIVIYMHGGIAGAAFVLMSTALLTLIGHLYVSNRLVKELFRPGIERRVVGPLMKFGGALAGAAVASVLLNNLEKLVLTRVASVEALAHYSVAFTLAMMTTTLSAAMTQSLIPAFSQLLTPGKREQLNGLFTRSIRINLILELPVLAVLFVTARPFFTIWAGEDFGRESTMPFYILLVGLAFSITNYVPFSLLTALGRTDIFAKLYWVELIPYIGLTALLTWRFGAVGAAAGCTIRSVFDTALIAWIAKSRLGVSFAIFKEKAADLLLMLAILAPPVLIAIFFTQFNTWHLVVLLAAVAGYFFAAWNNFLASEERSWIIDRFSIAFDRRMGSQ
jgi:O-antigen/teichoic acid export membrane protein